MQEETESLLELYATRNRKIFRMRLYDKKSFEFIGSQFDITRSRAWEIFHRECRKLRHPMRRSDPDSIGLFDESGQVLPYKRWVGSND